MNDYDPRLPGSSLAATGAVVGYEPLIIAGFGLLAIGVFIRWIGFRRTKSATQS